MQRALMHYFKPYNRELVLKALKKAGREDLIGWGGDCLIPPYERREKAGRPEVKGERQASKGRGAKGRSDREVPKGGGDREAPRGRDGNKGRQSRGRNGPGTETSPRSGGAPRGRPEERPRKHPTKGGERRHRG